MQLTSEELQVLFSGGVYTVMGSGAVGFSDEFAFHDDTIAAYAHCKAALSGAEAEYTNFKASLSIGDPDGSSDVASPEFPSFSHSPLLGMVQHTYGQTDQFVVPIPVAYKGRIGVQNHSSTYTSSVGICIIEKRHPRVSQNKIEVTWNGGSRSYLVSGNTSSTSDAFTFSDNAIAAFVGLKVSNGGTPVAADYVDFYYAPTLGDPDGSSTAEYPAWAHAAWVGRCSTYASNPGVVFAVITPGIGGRLIAVYNPSQAVTISASIREKVLS